jgi:uncharacterized membrane protein YphA (DoxX/SURF4 family)
MKLKSKSNGQILALCIGIVYLWFGMLKFFPGTSPAEDLAKSTMNAMTFGLIPSNISIVLLATWESLVGILLITNIYRRVAATAALVHIVLTFIPLFLFTEQMFTSLPFGFTLLGQYIFKNVIIIGALITLCRAPLTNLKTTKNEA